MHVYVFLPSRPTSKTRSRRRPASALMQPLPRADARAPSPRVKAKPSSSGHQRQQQLVNPEWSTYRGLWGSWGSGPVRREGRSSLWRLVFYGGSCDGLTGSGCRDTSAGGRTVSPPALSAGQGSGGQIRGLLAVLLTEGVFPFMRAADFIPPSRTLNAALGRWVPPEQTCLHLTRGNREALKGQFTFLAEWLVGHICVVGGESKH